MTDRSIDSQLSGLPRGLRPPDSVWDNVAQEIETEPSRQPAHARGRLVWLAPAAMLVIVLGLVLGFAGRRQSGATPLERAARSTPPELSKLYAQLDEHAEVYEIARENLLETVKELMVATGVSELVSLQSRIARVDVEIGALVARILEDPATVESAFELAALFVAETAMLGDIRMFASEFLE